MDVFIDSNVFLRFYSYSSDRLDEIKKVLAALNNGSLTLWVTDQVKNEISRNREQEISNALKNFNENKAPKSMPVLIQNHHKFAELQNNYKSAMHTQGEIVKYIRQQALEKDLLADHRIGDLFDASPVLQTTGEILGKAKDRVDLGNPPGKRGSLGDAVNWELLLEHVPPDSDLHIVSFDQDFASEIDKNVIKRFLKEEWEQRKGGDAFLYTALSEFFKMHFPEIKKHWDFEKHEAMKELAASPNFATTHAAIAKLETFSDFNADEAQKIFEDSLANTQVHWISGDEDVYAFLSKLFEAQGQNLPTGLREQVQESLLKKDDEGDSDDEEALSIEEILGLGTK